MSFRDIMSGRVDTRIEAGQKKEFGYICAESSEDVAGDGAYTLLIAF